MTENLTRQQLPNGKIDKAVKKQPPSESVASTIEGLTRFLRSKTQGIRLMYSLPESLPVSNGCFCTKIDISVLPDKRLSFKARGVYSLVCYPQQHQGILIKGVA